MAVRVDVERLPEDVARALERGETVVFERLGKVTAIARPGGGKTEGLWQALAKLAPLDRGFEDDIDELDEVTLTQGPSDMLKS